MSLLPPIQGQGKRDVHPGSRRALNIAQRMQACAHIFIRPPISSTKLRAHRPEPAPLDGFPPREQQLPSARFSNRGGDRSGPPLVRGALRQGHSSVRLHGALNSCRSEQFGAGDRSYRTVASDAPVTVAVLFKLPSSACYRKYICTASSLRPQPTQIHSLTSNIILCPSHGFHH